MVRKEHRQPKIELLRLRKRWIRWKISFFFLVCVWLIKLFFAVEEVVFVL